MQRFDNLSCFLGYWLNKIAGYTTWLAETKTTLIRYIKKVDAPQLSSDNSYDLSDWNVYRKENEIVNKYKYLNVYR